MLNDRERALEVARKIVRANWRYSLPDLIADAILEGRAEEAERDLSDYLGCSTWRASALRSQKSTARTTETAGAPVVNEPKEEKL